MNRRMSDLLYPIGKFPPPDTVIPDRINCWIDDIGALPADLRRVVSALTDVQLDTPYRANGWGSTMCQTVK